MFCSVPIAPSFSDPKCLFHEKNDSHNRKLSEMTAGIYGIICDNINVHLKRLYSSGPCFKSRKVLKAQSIQENGYVAFCIYHSIWIPKCMLADREDEIGICTI